MASAIVRLILFGPLLVLFLDLPLDIVVWSNHHGAAGVAAAHVPTA